MKRSSNPSPNVFDEGNKIYLDMAVANGNVFSFFPDASGNITPPDTIVSPLKRWVFDLSAKTGSLDAVTMFQTSVEFPRCDDRYAGSPHRHGFVIGQDWAKPYDAEKAGPIHPFFFNIFAHLDLATGRSETWFPGATCSVQEPIFVPRTADTSEGDGYVIGLVNRLAERATELVVLDSLRLQEGPIATVKLPVRQRMGLHGNWVPASRLKAASERSRESAA